MPTLRERKKRQSKEDIEKAALEIFLKQGYEKTTIAQIAKEANIGIGTFYNYFSSKSELFLATFWGNPDEIAEKITALIIDPGEDVVETVLQLINLYMSQMSNIKKEFWVEIFSVFMANIPEQKNNMKAFVDMDFQFLSQLQNLFYYYKQKGILSDTFDPQDGAQCIFGIFMFQMFLYIYDDGLTLDEIMSNISKQIRFFFANKFED